MGEKQLCSVEHYSVRHADIADRPARAHRLNRLHHRFLCADAFENRIRSHSIRQLPDARNTLVAPLGHDLRGAEFERKILPRLMAAHGDDSPCPHLLCREHAEQSNRAIADNDHGAARLYIGGNSGKPPRAHHIGERQQAWNQIVRRNARRRHKRSIRKRNAQEGACAVPTNSRCWQDDW